MRSDERQRVACDLFAVARPVAGGVLLVDDVVCTGSQARDAIRAIRAAGATEVRFVAVARATALPEDRFHTKDAEAYDRRVTEPVIVELLAVELLPIDQPGSRRAIVRWSDGTNGEALRFYDDEVLFCEGDLLGKTQADLRTLHFRRDREHLTAPSDE